ncbi:carbohydrate sulfotransferase 11 [Procambarus clarkii]|uniref:carbohydrate sulfotransferase 11 n=1 Tax=Procambarus clarkii TaxID=6728 RepID=UPI001E670DE2|nr:carbohydrate sulfotransferase 11-like [Procambarus clarkii]
MRRLLKVYFVMSVAILGTLWLHPTRHPNPSPSNDDGDAVRRGGKPVRREGASVRRGGAEWEAEQEKRRNSVRSGCRGTNPASELRQVLISEPRLTRLLVDDRHRAMYCFIPKVACTNWKLVWLKLTGRYSTFARKDNTTPDIHVFVEKDVSEEPRKLSLLKRKLEVYSKFLVVRHPYERLLSAFRDKVATTLDTKFQRKVLSHVQRQRPQATHGDIQWPEFVSYVVDGGHKEDEHWATYTRLCHPCAIRYNFIAKYETLVEDSEEILRRIGAPKELHFPQFESSDTADLLESYMRNLTQEQIQGLGRVYKEDFDLFQYSYSPQ